MLWIERGSVLLRVVVIVWRGCSAEIYLAFLANGHFVAVFIADVKFAEYGAANSAFVLQPFRALGPCHAVPFGPGIVFVDDRAPPLNHLLFDRDRTRRGSVDDEFQAAYII